MVLANDSLRQDSVSLVWEEEDCPHHHQDDPLEILNGVGLVGHVTKLLQDLSIYQYQVSRSL